MGEQNGYENSETRNSHFRDKGNFVGSCVVHCPNDLRPGLYDLKL